MDPATPKPPAKPVSTDSKTAGPGGPRVDQNQSGKVKFDDRGQAIWEWSMATGRFDQTSTTSAQLKKLMPELSIVDDAPPATGGVRPNPGGIKKGYDPYDSGRLGRTGKQKAMKKDLRKLGEWIDLRKQASSNKDEE